MLEKRQILCISAVLASCRNLASQRRQVRGGCTDFHPPFCRITFGWADLHPPFCPITFEWADCYPPFCRVTFGNQ